MSYLQVLKFVNNVAPTELLEFDYNYYYYHNIGTTYLF